MNNGFVKIYRSLLQWQWHDDPCMMSLWMHLIILANYEDIKWHGIVIKRGQLLTCIRPITNSRLTSLCTITGCSIYQIRSRLKKLEQCGSITTKTTNKFTIITICNYESYQEKSNTDQTQTNYKPNTNSTQCNHIIKEDKKNKEKKDNIYITSKNSDFEKPTIAEVKSYITIKNYTDIDAEQWFAYYESNGWKIGKNPMKNWKAAITTWHKSNMNKNLNQQNNEKSKSDSIRQRAIELITGRSMS